MIYSLRGTLTYKQQGYAVIECAGVGYRCMVTLNTLKELPGIGEEAFLFTKMVVREDAVELIGFATTNEMSCFKLLTGISGVGVKVAIAILSELTFDQVAMAVASNDAKMLTRAAGVGSKLAQRIILELKDKLSKEFSDSNLSFGKTSGISPLSENISQALDALAVLGYSPAEVTPVLHSLPSELSTQELITQTLKEFGKK